MNFGKTKHAAPGSFIIESTDIDGYVTSELELSSPTRGTNTAEITLLEEGDLPGSYDSINFFLDRKQAKSMAVILLNWALYGDAKHAVARAIHDHDDDGELYRLFSFEGEANAT